jgi:hypothetical protein
MIQHPGLAGVLHRFETVLIQVSKELHVLSRCLSGHLVSQGQMHECWRRQNAPMLMLLLHQSRHISNVIYVVSMESSPNDVIIIHTHNKLIVAFQHGSQMIWNDLWSYDVICGLCWQIDVKDDALLTGLVRVMSLLKYWWATSSFIPDNCCRQTKKYSLLLRISKCFISGKMRRESEAK